jgi:hypothetical protein
MLTVFDWAFDGIELAKWPGSIANELRASIPSDECALMGWRIKSS